MIEWYRCGRPREQDPVGVGCRKGGHRARVELWNMVVASHKPCHAWRTHLDVDPAFLE